MRFEAVADAIRGVPHMSPEHGRRVYDHIRAEGVREVLELGTAHGASAAYMAAAIEENGGGCVTTVDWWQADYDPGPEVLLSRAGLADIVKLVRIEDSSYDWYLKNEVAARSDAAGNCDPVYDFCFIDGAHNFVVDGLAVVLAEKLLRPDAWLLLDDLAWTYQAWAGRERDEDLAWRILYPLSVQEQTEPHMRAVFDLIVKQHPSFTEFRDQDDDWGWARKAPGEPRRYSLEFNQSLSAFLISQLKAVRHRLTHASARRRARA